MEIFYTLGCFIGLLYGLVILVFCIGFYKCKTISYTYFEKPKLAFSVLIPFRNESKHLPVLLQSIEKLNYPSHLLEFIFIDDHSIDGFMPKVLRYENKIVLNKKNTLSPKKDALTIGINEAKHHWIFTTDADCELPINLFLTLNQYLSTHSDIEMIAGPVICSKPRSFLEAFQQLDFLSLQATTIATFGLHVPFMCNGANFCYTKTIFNSCFGFQNHTDKATGDDVFLLQQVVKKEPEKVAFLKSSDNCIKTKFEKNWQAVIQQRVRWASKATNYSSFFAKTLGILVFVTNFLCVTFIILLPFYHQFLYYVVFILFIKMVSEALLLSLSASFFKVKPKYLFFSLIFYPFFSCFIVLLLLRKKYSWKERDFSF